MKRRNKPFSHGSVNKTSEKLLELFLYICACSVKQLCLLFVAHLSPLSLVFPRQEYWSRLPFPTPWNLPRPGTKLVFCISCIGRWILHHCTTRGALRIYVYVCVYVLVAHLCPTVYDGMDCSPPGSSVLGILQARILERLPFPSPEDLPDPRVESGYPEW